MHRHKSLLFTILVAGLVASGLTSCEAYRPPVDCADWRYGPEDEPAPGVVPAEYSRTEAGWKLGSLRDDDPALRNSLQNQCGQIGAAVDLAWGVTTGRDDVVIAVLDSGIEWRDPGDMADLATKAYLNRGELDVPCAAPTGDCNGDGRFDIADFTGLPDLNGNGLADPEDLILDPAQSDGVDDDRNGYVDDISGWDMLYGDNNPLDTVTYGHGTGEAKDSTAAADGQGDVGTCPQCRFLPVRVGDSFITEGGRFAAGVLFALDSRADVIQEALGVTSNPGQAQQAVDAAYERGVVVVASMADEASKHANLPAALENTMPVNSITQREHNLTGESDGWLALNGCTNWGAITWISVPSGSCSSEATGLGSGIVGLVESAARDAGLPRHPDLPRRGNEDVLSANEVMQVLAANADDVDFATPNAAEPANNYGGSTGDLVPSERYPTRLGWDEVNGFGRANAYEAVRLVAAGRIPPEAAMSSPSRFEVVPASGRLTVEGDVAARFADSYSYRVEWAVGTSPPAHPEVDEWHVVAEKTGRTRPQHGDLARIDLAAVAAALPGGSDGPPLDDAAAPSEDRFAVRVRVVVTGEGGGAGGLSGVMQKQIYVHDDPDLVEGYPRQVTGASTASPVFADLDGRDGEELIVATTDGVVHAYKANGRELRGWPAHTTVAPWWPTESRTASAEHIRDQRSAVMVGAPAVADLDGDGGLDVVVADHDGNIWAWDRRGDRLPGFGTERVDGGRRRGAVRINPQWSQDSVDAQDDRNRTKPGIVSSTVLGELDGDPQLEIVAAALDRHVYAWNHDGSPVAGWPVLLVDPDKAATIDPSTHKVSFVADSGVREGGEIVATPALADLDGDGRDEVIVGAQESYIEDINIGDSPEVDLIASFAGEGGNTRLYALSPDGRDAANPDRNPVHPDDTAYLPGWPVKVSQIQLEALPVIGDGIAAQAAVADVVPSRPGLEIITNSPVGPMHVFGADGQSAYGENPANGRDIPALWTGGLFGGQWNHRYGPGRNSSDIQITPAGFSGPAVGLIDGDDVADFAAPTAGLSRLVDVGSADNQLPNDDQLMAWQGGDTGNALAGFPQVTTDLAFFVSPAIADLDGDGHHEVIAGNGLGVLSAHEADGSRPDGWPKLHGGWVVGTPSLGDFDGDGLAELAVVRRDGTLFVWHTQQPADTLDQWPRFGGNPRNTGTPGG